jgi:hypothetical protein
LRDELETAVDDFEDDLLKQAERDSRALLGDDDFGRAFEHGRSLLLEDAAALVFDLTSIA